MVQVCVVNHSSQGIYISSSDGIVTANVPSGTSLTQQLSGCFSVSRYTESNTILDPETSVPVYQNYTIPSEVRTFEPMDDSLYEITDSDVMETPNATKEHFVMTLHALHAKKYPNGVPNNGEFPYSTTERFRMMGGSHSSCWSPGSIILFVILLIIIACLVKKMMHHKHNY